VVYLLAGSEKVILINTMLSDADSIEKLELADGLTLVTSDSTASIELLSEIGAGVGGVVNYNSSQQALLVQLRSELWQ